MRSSPQEELLNSWKEIASYLNRGVRTVQRWESELGLPVRRPRGRNRSAVIAMRSEIDEWLKSCPSSQPLSSPARNTSRRATQLFALILEGRELMEKTRRSRVELNTALVDLKSSVRSISSGIRPLRQAPATSCPPPLSDFA